MASVPEGHRARTADDIAAAIRADVLAGTLPQVSWVVTNQAFSEHPDAAPGDGAHFVDLVLKALDADPEVFNSTLLFLNYDENDGLSTTCRRRCPRPARHAPARVRVNGVPVGLGFRVPHAPRSRPWTRGGWVTSEVFDHTSVHPVPGEVDHRARQAGRSARTSAPGAARSCGDLTGAFDFATPVYGLPPLPDHEASSASAPADRCPTRCRPTTPCPPRSPAPGRRAPCPTSRTATSTGWSSARPARSWPGSRWPTRAPRPARAAHFSDPPQRVPQHRARGSTPSTPARHRRPTTSTSARGYGAGKYDISMAGPNRFLRRFTGDATKAGKSIEVAARFAVETGTGKQAIWFKLTNTSAAAVKFTIKADNYRTDGPWTYTVPAGGSAEDYFNAVAYQNGWYDFTVTADVGPDLVTAVHRPHRDRLPQRQRLRLAPEVRSWRPTTRSSSSRSWASVPGLAECTTRTWPCSGTASTSQSSSSRPTTGWTNRLTAERRTATSCSSHSAANSALAKRSSATRAAGPGSSGRAPSTARSWATWERACASRSSGDRTDPDPWHGVVSTVRIRDELGFRPLYPSVWAARDAGAL